MEGKGVYRYRDGVTYKGMFKNNLKHGKGKYTKIDGTTYKGIWVDGKLQGKGTVSEISNGIEKKTHVEWDRGKKIKITFCD